MRQLHGFVRGSFFAIALGACAPSVFGQATQLTEFTYSGGTGAQQWQSAANWGGSGFPNGDAHVANMSVPLAGSLTIDLGGAGSDVTVGGIKIGGTAGAVTTNITSSGALLKFQNTFVQALANADFSNNTVVDGADFLIWQRNLNVNTPAPTVFTGDADGSGTVDAADLAIWKTNYGQNANGLNGGRPQIITSNVAAGVNQISANIHLINENLEVLGGSNLAINGNITYENASPTEEGLDASISNTSNGITTTINGNLVVTNLATNSRFGLNTAGGSNGTLRFNGVISGTGDLLIGVNANGLTTPLNTVELNGANTFSGGAVMQRGNIVVNNPTGLGTGPLRQNGPSNQFGYNISAGAGALTAGEYVLPNNLTMAQWQTFKGDNSIRLTGLVNQTNNRGVVNLIAAGKTLTLDGQLDVWEDPADSLARRFVIDGTGKTIIKSPIRNNTPDPLFTGSEVVDRGLRKTGTGTLVIDVAPGTFNVGGPTEVIMGNLHFANNDSLNAGAGLINATGGAVGVDTGVATNAAFMAKINPATSIGGLQLAPSDAAATLDFTGTLANAAKMTVAAPETGMTFTGTIIPANAKYGLGGGTGKLTLPNAQLSGANALEVRNGGSVELLGANTYSGSTAVLAKYASTNQDRAAADNAQNVSGQYYKEVAPTLIVNKLANGGSASSIGSSSNSAANLLIQGSTLKYIGTGDSTDRLFTIGTGGATLDASGTGALSFTNTGALGRDDAESRAGLLDDFNGDPNVIYNLADTSDIIVGMQVSDPGAPTGASFTPGCGPGGTNCIPNPNVAPWTATTPITTITGVGDDGKTLGMSANLPNNLDFKPAIIVFGTVARTLTLTGTNTANNTISSVIGNSAAGSVVSVDKTGTGKWVLSGSNTYTGATLVHQGTLSLTSATALASASTVQLFDGGILNLNFVGTNTIAKLSVNGAAMATGTWGGPGSGAAHISALLSGSGLLNVTSMAIGALAAVPEPTSVGLAVLGLAALIRRRRSNLGESAR